MPFEFDTNNDEANEAIVTMEFHCDARGKGLGIGIIFDECFGVGCFGFTTD